MGWRWRCFDIDAAICLWWFSWRRPWSHFLPSKQRCLGWSASGSECKQSTSRHSSPSPQLQKTTTVTKAIWDSKLFSPLSWGLPQYNSNTYYFTFDLDMWHIVESPDDAHGEAYSQYEVGRCDVLHWPVVPLSLVALTQLWVHILHNQILNQLEINLKSI